MTAAPATIAMADPAGEYRLLEREIAPAVLRVLASGRYILGAEGEALEREIAGHTGAAHAVAMNSGTDALHLALRACGVGPGDEVIVPAFTFFATAEAVVHAGATPVFADVDARTFNLDPDSLRENIGPRTRAVIAVHLFGQCAAMDRIADVCDERSLALIEDAAQAIGADYDGGRAGSFGAFGCFSFYPTKNLSAAGDAGLVTCRREEDRDVLRMLRHHGSREPYLHDRVGYNSRLDEVQAVILRVKLAALDRFNDARGRVAAMYRERLATLPIELPAEHGRGRHVYHQFTIQTGRRDAIRGALGEAGIASALFYALPLHRQPAFADACRELVLPVAERAARRVLSLPVHALLDEASVERVCAVIRANV